MKQNAGSFKLAEIQGPYGPLQVLENQVQKIWAWQHLQPSGWKTNTGRTLQVKDAGHWNRGSGPDFKEAILELGGIRMIGDIEIHLYREDWWRHKHDSDPAYNDVLLHVVLFAGGMDREITKENGECVEEWYMGPYVREDIESMSGGIPGLFGEHVPELREWMDSDIPENIRHRLKTGADRRWEAKISMARCLMRSFSITGGLHRMVLYYLGFPYNRKSFYEMADAYPPDLWQSSEFIEILKERWKDKVHWNLGRPAGRAEQRLRQYILLQMNCGDWMRNLIRPPRQLIDRLRIEDCDNWCVQTTRYWRREIAIPEWSKWLNKSVLESQLNRGISHRLWVDVFLPFLTVTGVLSEQQAIALWFHCQPADYPTAYRELLRLAMIQSHRDLPLCNGWIQGMLWLEDQLRLERVRSALGVRAAHTVRSGA